MIYTPNSTVLVQGITTPLGRYSASAMKAYGMNVVAGTSGLGERGTFEDIPIYDLVEQAIERVGAIKTSIICVEPYAVLDAALEAIASGLRQLLLVTQGVPPLDMLRLLERARATKTFILGPGSASLIVPERILLGAIETQFYSPGNIGLIGRTDNLLDEIAWELTQSKLGQSIAVNLGTGEIVGSSFETWLPILDNDKNTDAILLVEHSPSGDRPSAIASIQTEIRKPVIAYIAGSHMPQPHPSASNFLLRGWTQPLARHGTLDDQETAFKKAKISVVNRPSQIPTSLKKMLRKKVNKSS